MNKTKIIVVEDNIVYCEYVCNMLSREGYRNMKAYHLSTAKKHLQQATDNDIVVADLRLPDGSGIDLLCWMRKEGKMQPFIIMTDYAEVNTAVESMKLGSIDYIPKQLVEDKLVPLIRSILKERQAGQRRMPIFAREGSAFQKIMHRIRLVAATLHHMPGKCRQRAVFFRAAPFQQFFRFFHGFAKGQKKASPSGEAGREAD